MFIYAIDTDRSILKQYENWELSSCPNGRIALFTNTKSAWDACQKEIPDAVILEYGIPGSMALLERLKTLRRIPVVLVCEAGNVTPALLNLGVFGILEKPLTAEQWNRICRNVFKRTTVHK